GCDALLDRCGLAIPEQDRVAGLGGDLRDARAHRARAQDAERLHQTSSTPSATASPPPMHSVAMPRFLPRSLSAGSSVPSTRAPEQPIGWPSDTAPPCTFTVSGSSPCSFAAAMVTPEKASLISYRSQSRGLVLVRSYSLASACTGAIVN